MKKAGFLVGSLMSIVLIDESIKFISEVIGFNEIIGLGAIAAILAIIFFIGLSMVLMYKAFTMGETNDITI